MSRNQYPKWDKNRGIYFRIGLLSAIIFSIFVLNINAKITPFDLPITDYPDENVINIPITFRKKEKVVTPPPPPIKKKKSPVSLIDLNADIILDKTNETKDSFSFVENTDTLSEQISTYEPPPVPIMAKEVDDEPILFPEQMPVFGKCVTDDREAREACSERALIEYIYDNLTYPSMARESGTEGTVFVSFVIDKHGKVKEAEIIRDIGAGCGQAAIKVFKNMPFWKPGKQNGRPVSVIFKIPIRFQLR